MTENENPPEESDAPETPPPAENRRLGKILVVLFSSIILVAFIGYQYLEAEFNRPANLQAGEAKRVHVRSGMSFTQILELLENGGLIKNPGLFHLQARLRGGAKSIQAGVYELKSSMPPREIYRYLSEGRVARRTFTVPEGYNVREIARTIQRAKLASEAEIIRLSRNPSFLKELEISAASIEGYLFPDTYHFPVDAEAKKILSFMVRTMRKKFSPALRKQAKAMGFTIHQTLTLASIIEKETSLSSERPLIAAVFINRLKRKMRLQSDPTVIYGLPHFDGNITKKDLRYDSPYNTYLYRGLPPGPIASPGLESIKSALNPANVKYLYFVATKDGGHRFSRTYREHRRAVNRYQRR
ncbi:MAG: endolytic transglycosylase MltG [Nitrospinae bacterium]|nr:endolytic transglycosylase MltG [Nitrospinota bacterium]